jgi:signal transduction histidine kinase
LIRDRAHMLGGTLDVESGPGRGTRVVLDIPETESAV